MKNKFHAAIGVAAAISAVAYLFYGNLINGLFPINTEAEQTMTTQASGVDIEDKVVGTGPIAAPGDVVTVHYIGRLTDDKVFDSSRDRGEPFIFMLGAGQVIKGWDQGLVGMKVGGTRRLTIAPDFGYGAAAVGPIPANSTLIFDVELLGVQKPQ